MIWITKHMKEGMAMKRSMLLAGSLVLGLALMAGRLDAEGAAAASLLDELFELERWGEEKDALDRHRVLRREVHAAKRFLDGLADGGDGHTV